MWSCFVLLCVLVAETYAGVKTRASAPGSVPYENQNVFFPPKGNSTLEAATTKNPINSTDIVDESGPYNLPGCLNVGSSAPGSDNDNLIDFGVPSSTTIPKYSNCTIVRPTETPNTTDCNEKEVDIVIILDISGSVGADNFPKMKTFVKSSLSRFLIGLKDIQVGLITFSPVVNRFNLSTYQSLTALENAIDKLSYGSGSSTGTHLALQYANQYSFTPEAGDRPNATDVLVIITDGNSDSPTDTVREANALKGRGVRIVSIGIGSSLKISELNAISSDQSLVFRVADFDALSRFQDIVHNITCRKETQINATEPTTTQESTTTPVPTTKPIKITSEATTPPKGVHENIGSSANGKSTIFIPALSTISTTPPSIAGTPAVSPIGTTKKGLGTGSGPGSPVEPAKRGVGEIPASSANAGKGSCQFFCPPSGSGGGQTSTNTGTGSGNGNQTGNGTATGTGSSTGGGTTKAPTGGQVAGTTAASGGVSVGTGTGGTGAGTGTQIQNGGVNGTGSRGGSGSGTGSNTATKSPNTGGGGSVNSGTTRIRPVTYSVATLPDLNGLTGVTQPTDCINLVDCRVYPKEKVCPPGSQYRPWAEVRCRRYCGFCDPHTSPPPCVDKISNCNEYDADLCTNPLYRLFREDNCMKFCGLCGGGAVTTTASG